MCVCVCSLGKEGQAYVGNLVVFQPFRFPNGANFRAMFGILDED